MDEYEIRILRSDGTPALITMEVHLSADAAIRTAKKLAGTKSYEVWRDDQCIYDASATKPTGPYRGGHPAA